MDAGIPDAGDGIKDGSDGKGGGSAVDDDAGAGAGGSGDGGSGGTGNDGGSGSGGEDTAAGGDGLGPTDVAECNVGFVDIDDGDSFDLDDCSAGFALDVQVETDAPEGSDIELFAGSVRVAQKSVGASGTVTFRGVTLDPNEAIDLMVSVNQGATECAASVGVETTCPGPTCSITSPVISDTHTKLNGIAAEDGGDRVSSDGAPYQAAFEVSTNADDGSDVVLTIGESSVSMLGTVDNGKAVFAGVTLGEDGTYEVQAQCEDDIGQTATSGTKNYVVDTTPPSLVAVYPDDDAHFGPDDAIQFCVETGSSDALDLPDSLGSAQQNLSVRVDVGGSSPETVAATSGGGFEGADGGCVEFECFGPTAKDYEIILSDDAGNSSSVTVSGITCASTSPDVAIVAPADGTGDDLDTHLLAAGQGTALVDLNSGQTGGQANVVACSSVGSGSARLLTGLEGGDLTERASTTTFEDAEESDDCPNGLDYVVRFTGASLLPGSEYDAESDTLTATELRVEVTSDSGDTLNETGSSPAVRLWVDSTAPAINILEPLDICGTFHEATVDITVEDLSGPVDNDVMRIQTDVLPITVTVTNGGSTIFEQEYDTLDDAIAVIEDGANIPLNIGSNLISITGTEPSGNVTTFGTVSAPCEVNVGDPPAIAFAALTPGATPVSGSILNAMDDSDTATIPDADLGTDGWQGVLRAVTEPAVDVEFLVNGSSVASVTADGAGVALSPTITIDDGDSVTIRAEADDGSGFGVGVATLSGVIVDTVAPDTVTAIGASVVERRGFDAQLTWTAAGDGAKTAAAGYVVKASNAVIDSAAKFEAAQSVTFTATPQSQGNGETFNVTGLDVGKDYYFAVQPFDNAGNMPTSDPVGGSDATSAAVRGDFNVKVVDAPTGHNSTGVFGAVIDGSTDLGRPLTESGAGGPDGYADLVVGGSTSGRKVYVYFGRPDIDADFPAQPDIVFDGSEAAGPPSGFGSGLAVVGDIDEDGWDDIAMGAPVTGASFPGQVYIFKGGSWRPTTMTTKSSFTEDDADYIISPVVLSGGFSLGSFFGANVAKLGDFNGDGHPDFAVGARAYSSGRGMVAVILGGTISYDDGMGGTTEETFEESGPTIQLGSPSDPRAFGTRAAAYIGEATSESTWFGRAILGTGPVLSGFNNSMLVGRSGQGATEPNKVYLIPSFTGEPTAYTTIDGSTLAYVGGANVDFGFSLARIGNHPNGPAFAAGHRKANATGGGEGFAFMGDNTQVFTDKVVSIGNVASNGSRDAFGIVLGSGFSGSTDEANVVGDSSGDLVITANKEGGAPPPVYIVNGDILAAYNTTDVDIAEIANVVIDLASLPELASTPWAGTAVRGSVANDIDGDGWGDIVLGEANDSLSPTNQGRMLILY